MLFGDVPSTPCAANASANCTEQHNSIGPPTDLTAALALSSQSRLFKGPDDQHRFEWELPETTEEEPVLWVRVQAAGSSRSLQLAEVQVLAKLV